MFKACKASNNAIPTVNRTTGGKNPTIKLKAAAIDPPEIPKAIKRV